MAVRHFDGVADMVRAGAGPFMSASASFAALVRPTVLTYGFVAQVTVSITPAMYGLSIGADGSIGLRSVVGIERRSAAGFVAAGRWHLIGASVTAGGYPRFHSYSFDTRTWQRETAASTLPTPPTQPTGVTCDFGALSGGNRYCGDLAAVALWQSALLDTSFDALATMPRLSSWNGVGTPTSLYLFDQVDARQAIRNRITGSTAYTRSGTTAILDQPPIPYHLPGAYVLTDDGWTWMRAALFDVEDDGDWALPRSITVLR